MINSKIKLKLNLALLLCLIQVAGIGVYAQNPVAVEDSVSVDALVADSLYFANQENIKQLESRDSIRLATDSIPPTVPEAAKRVWIPDANRAVWLAVIFPGAGQIYNKKYWKLPIIYGGFAGCAYALSWNSKMLKDYRQAHRDILDGDPNTASYKDLINTSVTIDEATDTRYKNLIKNRKNTFQRNRDISIFAFIGVYLLSIVDAYVDAELSNFDIGPDLSMKIEPTYICDKQFRTGGAVGMQCSLRF